MNKKLGRNEPCPCGSGKKFKYCHGSTTLTDKSEKIEVAGLYFDEKRKRFFTIKKSATVNQLRREIPKINESFDRFFSKDIYKISSEKSRIAQILFSLSYVNLDNPEYLSSAQQVCLPILLNAYDSILAALEVLRNGHRLQPGILIRSTLESLTTVLYLFQLPEDIPRFRIGQLDSTKTINKAKEIIPLLGPLWGFFSEQFAHLGEPHRNMNPLLPFVERDRTTLLNLEFIRVSVALLYITTELIFLNFVGNPRYWKRIGKGAYQYNPSREEEIWLHEFLDIASSDTNPD